MGHIGQKSVLGLIGHFGLVQSLFQDFLPLHFVLNLIINPAVTDNDLWNVIAIPHIYNAQLKELNLFVTDNTIIQIVGFAFGKPFPDILRRRGLGNQLPVLRVNPCLDIISCKPAKAPQLRGTLKQTLRPLIQAVGEYFIRFKINV